MFHEGIRRHSFRPRGVWEGTVRLVNGHLRSTDAVPGLVPGSRAGLSRAELASGRFAAVLRTVTRHRGWTPTPQVLCQERCTTAKRRTSAEGPRRPGEESGSSGAAMVGPGKAGGKTDCP